MAESKKISISKVLVPVLLILVLIVAVLTVLDKRQSADHDHRNEVSEVIDLKVGTVLPDLELVDLEGKKRKLSSLGGKVWVLNFWATWCGPCIEEIPSLNRLHTRFQDQGLRVVGVNMDESPEVALPEFRKKVAIQFPIFTDVDGKLADRMEVSGLPFTIVIDKNLKILFIELGERNWSSDEEFAQFARWLSETT